MIYVVKITNEKELKFIHKLYNIKVNICFYTPIWMYFNEDYGYIRFDYFNSQYSIQKYTIIDVKNLMRSEKLKKLIQNN